MKNLYLRFVSLIEIFENTICASGLVLTTVLVFAQVINRYWLHFEIMWLSDLALYFLRFYVVGYRPYYKSGGSYMCRRLSRNPFKVNTWQSQEPYIL